MANFLAGKPFALPEHTFPSIVETAPVAMVVVRDGRCVYGNKAFASLRACPGLSCGRTCNVGDILAAPLGLDWRGLSDQLAVGEELRRRLSLINLRGHSEDVEVVLQSLPEHREVLVTVLQTGEEARMRRLVDHLAFHDSLTELPNRALLFDRLSQALTRLRREDGAFALMVMDLDGFKEINDSWGHAKGDELLCAVAQRLLSCVRESDTVARLGGDEFALLLHGIGSEAEAERTAKKLLKSLAEPFDLGEARVGLGASLGIALCPHHGTGLDALLSQADQAMYRAKQEGKSCHAVSDGRRTEAGLMVRMPWMSGIPLGHESVDEQHLRLADSINAIIEAIANGREAQTLGHCVDRFEFLLGEHFAHEEALMAEASLVCEESHRASHRRMLGDLPSLRMQIWGGTFSTTVQSLKKWLLDHIRSDDKELVAALRSRGVDS
ncbi:MAG: diguanylate cyclase [Rhodocyclaceae bacterium]|nr:diguanylate cyclase [Rhodocyclaceae bacterium]